MRCGRGYCTAASGNFAFPATWQEKSSPHQSRNNGTIADPWLHVLQDAAHQKRRSSAAGRFNRRRMHAHTPQYMIESASRKRADFLSALRI